MSKTGKDKKTVSRKVYPVDLKAALDDGFKVDDKKIDADAIVKAVEANEKKYLSKQTIKKG